LVTHIKGKNTGWGIREEGVEKDIWAHAEGANRSPEKFARSRDL
jgi:hypothetical protein